MAKRIVWSSKAKQDLVHVISCLEQNWSAKVARLFLQKVDLALKNLASNDGMFPVVQKSRGIKKYVVTKHNSILFRLNKQQIEIIRLFDTRQNPNKLSVKD